MEYDDLSIDIEVGSKNSVKRLEELLDKFSSLKKFSDITSDAMQKFGKALSPISNKLKELKKDANDVSKEFKGKLEKALDLKPNEQLEKYKKQLQSLRDETSKLENVKLMRTSTSAIGTKYEGMDPMALDSSKIQGQLSSDIASNKSMISELEQKIKELNQEGIDLDIKNLVSTKEEAIFAIGAIKNKLKELEEGSEEFKKLSDSVDYLKDKFKITNKDLDKMSSKIKGLKKLKNSIDSIKKSFSSLSGITNKISGVFSKFGKKAGDAVGSIGKKMKKLTLGLLAVRTAMSLLTRSVNAYLAFDGALQDSVSNSWNMLGALLGPAIEYVANMFAYATTYIYSFIKALTGIDLVARANAKALDTQSKKMAGSAKEAKKALAPFDEIFNLNQDTGSGSGAGSDLNLIEVPEIDTGTIFDRLMKALKEQRWYDAGSIIAEGINDALSSIPWGYIQTQAQAIGTGIGEFLNGAVENLDWNLLGTTIGNGIQTAISFSYGFITTFNWSAFGKGLGDELNGVFSSIDWKMLAETVGGAIVGIFDSIGSFLAEVNWQSIGEDLKTFFTNLPWSDIWESIKTAISNAFTGFDDFLTGLFGEGGATVIESLAIALGAIATAIGLISTALGIYNVVTAISTAVSTAFGISLGPLVLIILGIALAIGVLTAIIITIIKHWDDLKNVMSTVFSAIGSFISTIGNAIGKFFTEVINGIKNVFNKVVDFFSPIIDFFANIFSTIFDNIKITIDNVFQIFSALFRLVLNIASPFIEGLIDGFKSIFKIVGIVISEAKQGFIAFFNTIKNGFKDAFNTIKTIFTPIVSFFSGVFDKIKSLMKTFGATVGNVISGAFKGVVNGVLRAIENILNNPINAINSLISIINKVPGISLTRLHTFNLPKLETGTNEIPYEGIYHLHPGEAVVPKKYNPALGNGYEGNERATEETNDLLRQLIEVVDSKEFRTFIGRDEVGKASVDYIRQQRRITGGSVI